jgi:hypothetical protein
MKKSMFTAFAVGLCMTANVIAQVPSYVPANGLVGWWPFSGNANDESGNGNNGTVNGATLTTDRFGNAGKAYDFDGIDDFIDLQNLTSNQDFSYSLWFNAAEIIDYLVPVNNHVGGKVISKFTNSVSSPNGWESELSPLTSLYSTGNAATGGSASTNPISINNWYNIICIYNSVASKILFYVNGVNSGEILNFQVNTNNAKIRLGARANSNPDFFFSGKLDDIGIWNRALSDQEISDLYNGNICYDYVTVTDTLVINTGITGYNPITYLNTLKIWPNPTNDHITIDAGNLTTMNGYSIKIEDAQGQQVFQNAVTQQQFYIDITTWGGNGLYFVRIIDPQGNTVDIKKIVLQ